MEDCGGYSEERTNIVGYWCDVLNLQRWCDIFVYPNYLVWRQKPTYQFLSYRRGAIFKCNMTRPALHSHFYIVYSYIIRNPVKVTIENNLLYVTHNPSPWIVSKYLYISYKQHNKQCRNMCWEEASPFKEANPLWNLISE